MDETIAHPGSRSVPAGTLPLFAATLFLSAFLLFSVQPFFAKMVLPRLGGSPAVWSVAMVFFQSMLLMGYAYAHWLTGRLPMRLAAGIHGVVLIIAFVALPIAVPAGWDNPPETGQAAWLLALFFVSVGLPFFAVSANAPLLQAWFSRTGHPHASDPYFLYGASNIGSFASLILFIVFFEPLFSLGTQSVMWSAGYAVLAALVGMCALSTVRARFAREASPHIVREAPSRASGSRPAVWALFSFVPSGLLVAVTAHISTDVAAAPFLWVVPLALFLLTFVVVFRTRPLIRTRTLSKAVVPAGILAIVAMVLHDSVPVWAGLAAHLAFFFIAALFCHAQLFERRPEAQSLTSFYLWMSFGGVLGGIFASLIAPFIFNWVAEYLLLIVATMLLRPELREADRREIVVFALVAMLVGAALVLGFSSGIFPALQGSKSSLLAMMLAACLAALAIQFVSKPGFVLCVLLVPPVGFLHAMADGSRFTERTFFGVVKVADTADGSHRLMTHGTTLHGAMRIADAGRPEPLTYYHETGGMASALRALQEARGGAIGHGGLVGLGTGSLICHARPGERWTAYEIDRAVADAATNPTLFRFMPECGAGVPIVIGDARLTLEKEADGTFDYLLIDAFSSDSIPVHLMTREAIRLYMDKTAVGGLVVLHISNRYLELESVLAAIAADEGLAMRAGLFGPGDDEAAPRYVNRSRVAVLARDPDTIAILDSDPRWQPVQPSGTRAWTDDFSNVFTALLRRL